MSKTMNLLASEVKKALDERNMKAVDAERASKGILNPGAITVIMRGNVPRSKEVLDTLDRIFDRPKGFFRTVAAAVFASREIANLGTTVRAVASYLIDGKVSSTAKAIPTRETYSIPVFYATDLKSVLDDKGYIKPRIKPAMSVELSTDYGPYAYGVLDVSSYMHPRVLSGEIAILSSMERQSPDQDFGVVGLKKGQVLIGSILTGPGMLTVTTSNPYSINSYRKKDVRFIHRVVGFHRPR